MSQPLTEDSADTVEAIRQLRAMGAVKVVYKGCEVMFDALPLKPVTAESQAAEYERMALYSAS